MKDTDSGNASWYPKGTTLAYGAGESGFGEEYILILLQKKRNNLGSTSIQT